MTEPDQIEFHERVTVSDGRSGARSLPVRAGIVAGTAALVIVGALAAMGASPAPSTTGGDANLLAAAVPEVAIDETPFANGFRGGFARGGFHVITISAINGSSLSLETADGWTRTITVGDSTTLTEAGETIALTDLAIGDQIAFAQERQTDGSYSITTIKVVLPTIGGEVTAVSDSTITVTGKDGTTGTIHVDADTTYQVDGDAAALSDITVGSFVVAEGTLRADGSLDADRLHSGMRGLRDGDHPGRGFHDRLDDPAATPTPAESSTAS